MRAETKTHYVTLRLMFDSPLSKQKAVQAAIKSLRGETLATALAVTDQKTKAITRRIVSFKINRIC